MEWHGISPVLKQPGTALGVVPHPKQFILVGDRHVHKHGWLVVEVAVIEIAFKGQDMHGKSAHPQQVVHILKALKLVEYVLGSAVVCYKIEGFVEPVCSTQVHVQVEYKGPVMPIRIYAGVISKAETFVKLFSGERCLIDLSLACADKFLGPILVPVMQWNILGSKLNDTSETLELAIVAKNSVQLYCRWSNTHLILS